MVTLLLIVCNQEQLLKKRLSCYLRLLDSINGKILIVDDGSTDQTKDYLTTHFESITYMRNQTEIGYCKTFNNVLAYIQTPYLLCIDLNIDVRSLPLQAAIISAKNHNTFVTNFSFSYYQQRFHGYQVAYQGFQLYFQPISVASDNICSEIMLFDTGCLKQLNGLSTHYHSISFTWLDLIYRSTQAGNTSSYNDDCICYKESSLSTFFSYLPDQHSLFKDNFLFQWRFYSTFKFRLKRMIAIFLLFLSFKGSKTFHFLQAYFQWLLFTKHNKLSYFKLFISRFFNSLLSKFSSASFTEDKPILFTNHTDWDSPILKRQFSFKYILNNLSSPLFIDIKSLSKFTYYSLRFFNRTSILLGMKPLFYFVSSNYSLEHALAHHL